MSSWNKIMNTEETLTWVDRHIVPATDWGGRRVGEDERWKVNKEGKAPALKPTTLKSNQELIEPRGEPDGAAFTPPYASPTSRVHPVVQNSGLPKLLRWSHALRSDQNEK